MKWPSAMACIGLGGNLGDRAKTLDDAVSALADTPGLVVHAVSSFHRTNPIGGPEGQGAFLNAAAVVETDLDPPALLRILQAIEDRAGRVRRERWGARTLDLDLLLAGTHCSRTVELTLPHPLMTIRRFVLAPLAEIAPDAIHPTTGRTVADLLTNVDRRPSRIEVIDADEARRPAVIARLIAAPAPSQWIVGPGDDPAIIPTFRICVGDPRPELHDGIPTVSVDLVDVDAIAAHILALCRATRGE